MSDMTMTGRVGEMTKGPWQRCSDSIYYDKDGPEHRRIATIALYGAPDLEAEANSKAIVAVPELVEVLQRVQASCQMMLDGDDCDLYDMAEAIRDRASEALKKAGCL